jgi:imidazolonepropionase-like amidohydrolase
MKTRAYCVALFFALCPFLATPQPQPPSSILVKAARLLDVRKGAYVENAGIWIEGERIKEVGPIADVQSHAPKDVKVVDLGRATLLPGLIDCHTHITQRLPSMANFQNDYIMTFATKSQAFRALEAACNARATLEAGFTSIRDCESEGAGYTDIALRDAIKQGLVEGPRMQVATRAIAAVGQYPPFGVSTDLRDFPTGAQMVSGVEEARRAVREQIGHGADFIKVYADWEHPTLSVDEIRVIVEEAHRQGRKVAAHATTPEGIRNAVTAGVDSIEHGHEADRQILELLKEKGIFLVPTVGIIDSMQTEHKDSSSPPLQALISEALGVGVKMASGFDAGTRELHGNNANELLAMNRRGMPPLEAIRCATVNAAELMSWQDRVGAVEPGKYADLIAVEGDPLSDLTVLRQVKFVMKGGTIVKDKTTR